MRLGAAHTRIGAIRSKLQTASTSLWTSSDFAGFPAHAAIVLHLQLPVTRHSILHLRQSWHVSMKQEPCLLVVVWRIARLNRPVPGRQSAGIHGFFGIRGRNVFSPRATNDAS